RVREMSYKKPRKILIIEPGYFTNNTMFLRALGTVDTPQSLREARKNGTLAEILRSYRTVNPYPIPTLIDIDKTTTLQYNAHTGKYLLLVPVTAPPKKYISKKIDCGCDGGGRTFMTTYSIN